MLLSLSYFARTQLVFVLCLAAPYHTKGNTYEFSARVGASLQSISSLKKDRPIRVGQVKRGSGYDEIDGWDGKIAWFHPSAIFRPFRLSRQI